MTGDNDNDNDNENDDDLLTPAHCAHFSQTSLARRHKTGQTRPPTLKNTGEKRSQKKNPTAPHAHLTKHSSSPKRSSCLTSWSTTSSKPGSHPASPPTAHPSPPTPRCVPSLSHPHPPPYHCCWHSVWVPWGVVLSARSLVGPGGRQQPFAPAREAWAPPRFGFLRRPGGTKRAGGAPRPKGWARWGLCPALDLWPPCS